MRLWNSSCLPVCMSVCAQRTTRLSLDGFSLNLKFEDFTNMQVPLKIWRDETNGYFSWRKCTFFLLYIAYFFLKWLHRRPSMLRNTYIVCLVSLCFQLRQARNLTIYLTVMSTNCIVSLFLIIICHKMSRCDYGISLSRRFIACHFSLLQIHARAYLVVFVLTMCY